LAFAEPWRQAISSAARSSGSLSAASVARVQPRRPQALSSAAKASGDRALKRLFVGRKFDVGGQFVRREGRERDPRLEGAAVEVRVFGDAGERKRDPAELGGVGRGPLAVWCGQAKVRPPGGVLARARIGAKRGGRNRRHAPLCR
jgi:hypothetical protein